MLDAENTAEKRKREEDTPEPELSILPVRKPNTKENPVRQLVTDDRLTVASLAHINVDLTCPVCLGIIRNAMTVMECVHRFCEMCITKCLRLGKKECPSCRVKCVSRRSLRRDPNFDAIVRKVYPRLEEYEAEQDAMIERDNAFHAVARHERSTQNAKEEAKRVHEQLLQRRSQAAARRGTTGRKVRQAGVPKAPVPAAAAAATNRSIKRPRRDLQPIMESDVEFAFTLRRHPQEEQLQCLVKEYLKTSRLLTVLHLQKFLSMKLQWQSHSVIYLTDCAAVEDGVMPKPLDGYLTLENIYKDVAAFRKHPILYYYCKSSTRTWDLPPG